MSTFRFHHQGEELSVQVTAQADGAFTVTVGDRSYTVQAEGRAPGELRLWLDGRPVQAHVVRTQGCHLVAVQGATYRLESARGGRGRSASGAAEDAAGGLRATMPGQILLVQVNPGDPVQAGDTLLVMEAMKMELRVTAPVAGQVKAVHCREGEIVERGHLLVEIQEDGHPEEEPEAQLPVGSAPEGSGPDPA